MTDSAFKFGDLIHGISFYRTLQLKYPGFATDPKLPTWEGSLTQVRGFTLADVPYEEISKCWPWPPAPWPRDAKAVGPDAHNDRIRFCLSAIVMGVNSEQDIPWKSVQYLRDPIWKILYGESADRAFGLVKPAHRPSKFHKNVVLALDLNQVLSWGGYSLEFAVGEIALWAGVGERTVTRSWQDFRKVLPAPSLLLKFEPAEEKNER